MYNEGLDQKLKQDNMAKLMHMAVDYAKGIEFKEQFLIEPKNEGNFKLTKIR